MDTYKVRKDNIEFHIQPEMIEWYTANGYEVFKLTEIPIANPQLEMQKIKTQSATIKLQEEVDINEQQSKTDYNN